MAKESKEMSTQQSVIDGALIFKEIEEKYRNYFKLVQSYVKTRPLLAGDAIAKARRFGAVAICFVDEMAGKCLALGVGKDYSSHERQVTVLEQAIHG
jgi:hypothetical protein